MSKLSRAVKLILVVWLVALSFALPQALQFGVIQHELNPNIVMCTMKRILVQHSFELSTFLFFVVPMSLITVLYALIGLKLRKSNMMKKNSSGSGRNCRHHPGRSSRRVLKMLVAVVIAFFICWAPFHVQRLVAIYGTNTEDHITSNSKWMEFLYLLLTYISGVLYYVSTTINPILYNIMSNKFRAAFMETLSRSCRIPGLPTRKEHRSYSSLSRSQQQQRTANGGCGSKTLGTIGTIRTFHTSDALDVIHTLSEHSIQAQPADDAPAIAQEIRRDASPSGDASATANAVSNVNASASASANESGRANGQVDANAKKDVIGTSGDNSSATEQESVAGVSAQNARNDRSMNRARAEICSVNKEQCRKNQGSGDFRSNSGNTSVRLSNLDGSGKRWWRFLKWLPGLKTLKVARITSHFSPDSRVPEDSECHQQDFPLTLWNTHETHDQRIV